MIKVAVLVLALMLTPTLVGAHIQDPIGCSADLMQPNTDNMVVQYEGVSPEGRDYILQIQTRLGNVKDAVVQYHFMLAPKSQQVEGKGPGVIVPALTMFVDRDHDGVYEDMYLDPRHESNCSDLIHFRWMANEGQYRIVTHPELKR